MYKLIIEDLSGKQETEEVVVDCLIASYHIKDEEATHTRGIRAVDCSSDTLLYCYLDAKISLLKIRRTSNLVDLLESMGLADKMAEIADNYNRTKDDEDPLIIDTDATNKGRQ